MTREELLAEAAKEIYPPTKKSCCKCGGSGVISIGGGCMGYDDEPCPICFGNPNTPSLKEILEDAKATTDSWRNESSLNCPRCGGSLCAEEWHDCESDREWRRAQ
jgi:hypothetical protein